MLKATTLRGSVISRRHFNNATIILLQKNSTERKFIKKLPLSDSFNKWRKSLANDRLHTLQDELIELMMPSTPENSNVIKNQEKVIIDSQGNYLNEINFEIINDKSADTKHIVFIHGYGAALGCFARNFELINKFKDKSSNYKIHFLDNITFGLSSNPRVENAQANKWKIERCPPVKLIDNDLPTDKSKLHNKYYKLIDGYQVNPTEFIKYQKLFIPVLKDLENFYTLAIDNWRKAKGFEQIDYLIGHSYAGYWSASYSLRYPKNLKNLILLSPVGVERHVQAVTNDIIPKIKNENEILKPSLDPSKYDFLTRYPILSKQHIEAFYWKVPLLPRILKLLGPWGYRYYFNMWFAKLFKINKVKANLREKAESLSSKGETIKETTKEASKTDDIYGSTKEIKLIIDYLYNAITNGSNTDIYVRNLLTPSSVAKYPLYDKFRDYWSKGETEKFDIDFVYGEYDFMNAEAAEKLVKEIGEKTGHKSEVHKIRQGGHNLYIDNPWDTNQLIHDIVMKKTK